MGNALWEDDTYAAEVAKLASIDEDLIEVFEDDKEAIKSLVEAEKALKD
jgi:hypothetical protein